MFKQYMAVQRLKLGKYKNTKPRSSIIKKWEVKKYKCRSSKIIMEEEVQKIQLKKHFKK